MKKTMIWQDYIGDCNEIQQLLISKPNLSCWFLVKVMHAVFKGFGQVVFVNNPFGGVLIFLGLLIGDPVAGGLSICTATIATITSMFFQYPTDSVLSGMTSFNAVLVGSVTGSLIRELYPLAGVEVLWAVACILAVFSVLVTSATKVILEAIPQQTLPYLTLPFNVIILVIGACVGTIYRGPPVHRPRPRPRPEETSLLLLNTTVTEFPFADHSDPVKLQWDSLFQGILLSAGQVFGVKDIACSVLIILAIAMHSRVLLFSGLGGAFINSITGVAFFTDLKSIYSGLWGYNSFLVAEAIMVFCQFNVYSIIAAFFASFFVAGLQETIVLSVGGGPVYTLPFVIGTIIVLAAANDGNVLKRSTIAAAPEQRKLLVDYPALARRNSNPVDEV